MLYDLYCRKKVYCAWKKIRVETFKLLSIWYIFLFNTSNFDWFWQSSLIIYEFSFGKIVIAGLLRIFAIISRTPKTNKIIHSNFKFANTHLLGSNIDVNILESKKQKRSMCPWYCHRLLLEEEIEESSFLVFVLV